MLVAPLTVACTSYVPVACLGATAVQLVLDGQVTAADFAPPNLMIVTPVPTANPVPVTVTEVPPAAAPDVGLTAVTVGTYLKWSVLTSWLVPAGDFTVTSTVPATWAGDTATIFVGLMTLKLALSEPNLTIVAP